jgi:AcrR family transcriptional regulator
VEKASQRGRPRDAAIDGRVLTATRELLLEEGWEGTTIRGIAARAGVSRPAITRRWPSKAWLVMHAILGPIVDLDPFAGVDRDGWVQAVIAGSFDLFGRPEVKAAVPGLLAAVLEDDDLRSTLFAVFSGPTIDMYSGLSDDTPGSGEREVDAQVLIMLAAGAAMFFELVIGGEPDDRRRRRIHELLEAVAARAQTS